MQEDLLSNTSTADKEAMKHGLVALQPHQNLMFHLNRQQSDVFSPENSSSNITYPLHHLTKLLCYAFTWINILFLCEIYSVNDIH